MRIQCITCGNMTCPLCECLLLWYIINHSLIVELNEAVTVVMMGFMPGWQTDHTVTYRYKMLDLNNGMHIAKSYYGNDWGRSAKMS